jgi:glycosyltransferase involved in cell wall biosynthesis
MNKTLGTASNKIYEYAASGMPVLVYDNEHFRSTLQNRLWVIFTDTSTVSLQRALVKIMDQYKQMEAAALNDFETELCFEKYFNPFLNYLSKKEELQNS